jgi:hypothetical protein
MIFYFLDFETKRTFTLPYRYIKCHRFHCFKNISPPYSKIINIVSFLLFYLIYSSSSFIFLKILITWKNFQSGLQMN